LLNDPFPAEWLISRGSKAVAKIFRGVASICRDAGYLVYNLKKTATIIMMITKSRAEYETFFMAHHLDQ
jgi:hypothetical protein